MSFLKTYKPRSATGWVGALLFVFCTISLFGGFAEIQSASANGTIPAGEAGIWIDKSAVEKVILPGQTAVFEIVVTNDSKDVDVTDIVLSDPMCDSLELVSDGNGGDDDLAPGEEWVYTCEIDNVTAKVENIATVSGTAATGDTVEATSEKVTVHPLDSQPSIVVEKTTTTPAIYVGDSAVFEIEVTNDGNLPLSAINVIDTISPERSPGVSYQCPLTLIDKGDNDPLDKLERGETWIYTCIVRDVQHDLVNTVTATGKPLNGAKDPVSSTDTVPIDVMGPSLSLQKGPAKQTIVAGTDAVFTIEIKNDGDVLMTDAGIRDPQCDIILPADTGPFNLAPGESRSFECTIFNVTDGFTNTAAASGKDPLGGLYKLEATADVNVTQPSIEIQKGPEKQVILSGDSVTFSIVVTNTGDVQLTNVIVDDPECGSSLFPSTPRTLAPGESENYTCTVNNVTDHFVNVATATGTGPGGTTVSDDDDARVLVYILKLRPSIVVNKAPEYQEVAIGNTATFYIDVTNDGNVALKDVVVDDSMCAPLTQISNGDGDIFLDRDEIWTYECVVPNVQADFTNTVKVQGFTLKDPQKLTPATGSSSANVHVLKPLLNVSKTPDKQSIPAGGTATFQIEVTNKSALPMEHVELYDPKCKALVKPTDTILDPGETWNYTCVKPHVYKSFTNVAWATACVVDKKGICVQSELDEAEVNIIEDKAPSITVSKKAGYKDDAVIHPGGGNVTFYVTVANNSDPYDPVTITSMTDDLYGDLLDPANPNVHDNTCAAVTIDPGNYHVCEFRAVVVPPAVTDIVSVTAVDDEGQTASGQDEATVGLKGDVDCDKQVSAVDALKILRFDVGLIKIFKAKACTLGVPSVNLYFCKFTDNQTACGAIQALHILRCDVGYKNLLCPENDPAGTTFDNETTAVSVGLDLATIPAGTKGSIMVPVHLSPNEGLINAATVEVRYDSTLLRPKGCTANPEKHYQFGECNVNYADGIVRLNAVSSDGVDSSARLANLEFEVIGNLNVDTALGMNVVDISGADGVALPVLEATNLNISQLPWGLYLPVVLK